jgi:hypothetical protein
MKKRISSVWVILTLIAVLLVAPASVSATATRMVCTGWEIPLGVLDPGVWTYPDGNIHVRSMVMQSQEVSDCPQLAGINTVTMSANWDANQAGPIWGTAEMMTDDGGVLASTWSGRTYADGSSQYRAVGHGVAGPVQGLHMKLSATNGQWTATILDPHGE